MKSLVDVKETSRQWTLWLVWIESIFPFHWVWKCCTKNGSQFNYPGWFLELSWWHWSSSSLENCFVVSYDHLQHFDMWYKHRIMENLWAESAISRAVCLCLWFKGNFECASAKLNIFMHGKGHLFFILHRFVTLWNQMQTLIIAWRS